MEKDLGRSFEAQLSRTLRRPSDASGDKNNHKTEHVMMVTFANEFEDEELKVDEESYAHLVMHLYQKEKTYHSEEALLGSSSDRNKVQRKDCFGIINTIDDAHEESCSNFKDIADMFRQEDFFSVPERQQAIFDILIKKLGYDISTRHLRRYCYSRRIHLEAEEDSGWPFDIAEAKYEELKIILRIGELGSSSTREDWKEVEEQFGNKASDVRSRKVDYEPSLMTKKPIQEPN
ncbi:hypothetical protein BX616_001066 [Lobosporangium transversale]|uniref:Uncharacterized protein n=1 Tax=Lobosporangium transversale TaxID=64571 RepID=A0A1Y2GMQ2_9FUNG|nr:hypothetical protein BCR41DRAFT_396483 [Lobosporangium transversale]KAF9905200.1 hypothetical protein BX616_001066 [Lobosporangium transversale]ORZ15525.1 hypothetical protein BCR41DRAFT_396483 [Lobosporangium transversale]|eukprot:XP_021881273.1 hypothetical protein BCR41DRAFT_396483 [Lobosporangium transversale]